MKKKISFLLVCAIVTLAYVTITYLGYVHNSQEDIPLSEWVVGKWQGEREFSDETGTHTEEIQVEFLQSGVLIYQSSLSRELEFGVVFKYHFVSNDQLALNGRFQDDWDLTRKGSYLLIKGGTWRNQTVTFERLFGFERIIVLILGMFILGILFYRLHRTNEISNEQDSKNKTSIYKGILGVAVILGMHLLILAVGFKIGQLIVSNISITSLVLHQGLPWYLIILMEASLIMLLLGVQVARANSRVLDISIRSSPAKYYLGIFLIGLSFYGLFIGLLRLVVLYFLPLMLT